MIVVSMARALHSFCLVSLARIRECSLSSAQVKQDNQPHADGEADDDGDDGVDRDRGGVGRAGLAVVLIAALLADDVRKYPGTKRAAPPGEAGLPHVRRTALGTRDIFTADRCSRRVLRRLKGVLS